ncbi:MAG: helix-turn-helix domain-containing protein [Gammaproteobacteria bacterium]|uniref:AraC family transcriptional regulator n=1 Tax=Pseudomaricurvus alcaniphilus TaxID=1166482 RepID=UPI001408BB8F|nr:AraC family transcriptional regulator ligand-binding domain-containing protein [Pseudomaricurvus alcaniphilus]MBR9911498.1 helix-turn-helix domain-containing protein [Gammaproteobacteria bacterium]NHN35937.1 helix-turn-helix domain-containing protein [Pseudomaricurvus alcaniphilus]
MATIGTHYIKSALGGAIAKGLDPKVLLKEARIPEKPLRDPKARIHVDLVAKLYDGIAKALNDEFMGFTERPCKVGTFALMADWVSSAHTLEELLTRGIRFYNQITDELQMSLVYEGDHVYLTTVFRRPELDFEHFYIEYWHVIWHRFASWYIGKPIKLLAAYINYTPIEADEFRLLFRCPTYLKSKFNRLVFHRSYLGQPLVRSQRELQVFLRRAPIDLLTIPGEDTSLTARINQMLTPPPNQVIELPNSSVIAQRLGMSEQTLRRKLSAEGISYQQIKDNLRSDLASKLLGNRNLTIAAIAKLLDFSEPRAFTRAFKQWQGQTPKEYRAAKQAAALNPSSRPAASS